MYKKESRILAHSLAQGLKGLEVMSSINRILVQADGDTGALQVLKHGDAARLAMSLYQEYVSDEDFTYFVDFVKQLDSLILKFRGGNPLNLEEMGNDDDEEDTRRSSKGRKNKGMKNKIRRSAPSPSSKSVKDNTDDSDESVVISNDLIEKVRRSAIARKKVEENYGVKLLHSNYQSRRQRLNNNRTV